MKNIEELKSEITEIEECLSPENNQHKPTSLETRINNYLTKLLQEKKQELVDREK